MPTKERTMENIIKKYNLENSSLIKNALMESNNGVLIFLVDHARVSFTAAVELILSVNPSILHKNLEAYFYGEENV